MDCSGGVRRNEKPRRFVGDNDGVSNGSISCIVNPYGVSTEIHFVARFYPSSANESSDTRQYAKTATALPRRQSGSVGESADLGW